MKKIYLLLCCMLPVSLFSLEPDAINRPFINAAKNAKKSVVNIIIFQNSTDKGKQLLRKTAYGSGTIISAKGIVVTNRHVLMKGNHYRIITHDGQEFDTRNFPNNQPFLEDPKTDIAIIAIHTKKDQTFTPVQFSDSNNLMEGEWVLAIGNPYGLGQSISGGIVSSTGRDNIGFVSIEDFIQTDVAINPGNSGGPLINLYGKMVGMNTAIRSSSGSYQGISFSIPSNIVRHAVDDLLVHGRVRRGWIGFMASEKWNGSEFSEIVIISVIKDSPAEEAGLEKNDIIQTINGERVTSLGSLLKFIGNSRVGTRLTLSVSRSGRPVTVTMILREKSTYRQIKDARRRLFEQYGFEFDEYRENDAVIISYIAPTSTFPGLQNGDRIIACNGKNTEDMDRFIASLASANYRIAAMTVMRNNRELELFPR